MSSVFFSSCLELCTAYHMSSLYRLSYAPACLVGVRIFLFFSGKKSDAISYYYTIIHIFHNDYGIKRELIFQIPPHPLRVVPGSRLMAKKYF